MEMGAAVYRTQQEPNKHSRGPSGENRPRNKRLLLRLEEEKEDPLKWQCFLEWTEISIEIPEIP
jgi:hypothetical protein